MTPLAGLLAPDGTLRAAINTGNKALVQEDGGHLTGVSPALARRLAEELGVPLEPVLYPGAGKVVADAQAGVWTVAFLAVDPAREDHVAFTRPYVTIDTTYAVRPGGPATVEDVDRAGVTILSAAGSAYDLHLDKSIRHAAVVKAESPGASMDRFIAGEGDAVAGVRASLAARFTGNAGAVILPGALAAVGQAMAVPVALREAVPLLGDFLARARGEGMIEAAIEASGAKGLTIPDR
ncbi:transporter substrate-binding domain-containing protein [Acuticoccus sediminis]|uniref:transporter substrate-binding domain-containing protein n=1 Tax=Acuticoccus sediminis TaxID=2184697 RepID=UPI001391CA67|nr:transporter substrate-binding domain-containing protein [Acuticoccus sediminis]